MKKRTKVLIILALLTLAFVSVVHCAVTTRHENSLGVPMYTSNPLMYVAGSLATNQDAVSNIDGNLNIRISPLGTYMLYDESVLFCGLPMDKFQGVTEPFVIAYERVARKTVQGVGCHELIAVHSLKTEKVK
jgi:hypothetical protein